MINQVMGFFSSQRQLLKGWELPVAGLLLTTGLAVSVATVKTTASPHKAQAVNTITASSTLETAQTQTQEPAVASSELPSTVTAEPQPQEPAVDSSELPSTVTAEVPQPQEPAVDVDSSVAPSTLATVVPKSQTLQKRMVESPAVSSQATQRPQSQEQEATAEASEVPSPVVVGKSQPQEQAVDAQTKANPSVKWNKWNRKAQEFRKLPIAQVPNPTSSMPDGTYLYGQTSQPGQIGNEYVVFEARQGKVVGAMYMPSSEYACFYGTLNSKQMNLTVVNPHNQTAFSHSIAREQTAQMAAAGGQINIENAYDSLTYPHSVGLDGYLPINQVGDNDKQILSTCLSNYQAKAWNQ
ncbi:hypothetical protein [Allocoleopsis franciscana]|uniref:Uncharacterized protein n=1 Tax=Allocoleopsis franciscana PCC 7113 TaxID=1173027 RepID=K9W8Z7_9CYAN|nr:hypothetical protein [Allocoleopsis franciscana]AFZ16281.1 hypothetical protein Mic7113_0359 [Allocoleopsis franciscana PCC 7113]